MLHKTGILAAGPLLPPDTIEGWFELLKESPLIGFTLLNGFDLFNYIFVGVVILVLWINLRRTNFLWSNAAGILGFSGAVLFALTNKAFTLHSLSRQYMASNQTEHRMLLEKGTRLLAVHESNSYAGTGLYPSFFLVTTALMLFSVVMLRSQDFRRSTAYLGILANGSGLAYYPVLLLNPGMVYIPLSVSAVFLLAWYIILAFQLIRITKFNLKEPPIKFGPDYSKKELSAGGIPSGFKGVEQQWEEKYWSRMQPHTVLQKKQLNG
jgi:hypothetical protein